MNAANEPLATAMAQAAYYARRAGYLEGALLVISWGTSNVDPQEAARRALAGAAGTPDSQPNEGTCPP